MPVPLREAFSFVFVCVGHALSQAQFFQVGTLVIPEDASFFTFRIRNKEILRLL